MKKEWKKLEQLVAVIERSIDPQTKVEHDVKLSVINSPSGRVRQCDVVLRKGPKHRETLTIIEVQHRKIRVKISEFNDWLVKMIEVGAQHLICVSLLPFPASVKEKARSTGNSVKLVHIGDHIPEEIPLCSLRFAYRHFHSKSFENSDISFLNSTEDKELMEAIKNIKQPFRTQDKVFSTDGANLISINEICQKHITVSNTEHAEKRISILSTCDDVRLYHKVGNKLFPCSLSFQVFYADSLTNHPVNILSYSQDEHGALAWIAEMKYESPVSGLENNVKLPITKLGGDYVAHEPTFDVGTDSVNLNFGTKLFRHD